MPNRPLLLWPKKDRRENHSSRRVFIRQPQEVLIAGQHPSPLFECFVKHRRIGRAGIVPIIYRSHIHTPRPQRGKDRIGHVFIRVAVKHESITVDHMDVGWWVLPDGGKVGFLLTLQFVNLGPMIFIICQCGIHLRKCEVGKNG